MKKYVGAGVVLVMVLATVLLGSQLKFFIDLPSLIFVGIIGGVSMFLVPEKKGKAFIEAGWLIFSIGIIAGLFSRSETSLLIDYGATVAVAAISLMYGYLFGIIADILLKKDI